MKYIFHHADEVLGATDAVIQPVRKSILKRFPTLFGFLVTIGATATFLGLEQIIISIPWLHDRPYVIFGIGVFFLVCTGRLYKKLG